MLTITSRLDTPAGLFPMDNPISRTCWPNIQIYIHTSTTPFTFLNVPCRVVWYSGGGGGAEGIPGHCKRPFKRVAVDSPANTYSHSLQRGSLQLLHGGWQGQQGPIGAELLDPGFPGSYWSSTTGSGLSRVQLELNYWIWAFQGPTGAELLDQGFSGSYWSWTTGSRLSSSSLCPAYCWPC